MHRDIKLENILLMHPDPTMPEQVRLADFEFSVEAPAVGPVGSLAYSAPGLCTQPNPTPLRWISGLLGLCYMPCCLLRPLSIVHWRGLAPLSTKSAMLCPSASTSRSNAGSRSRQLPRTSSTGCSIPIQQSDSAWSLHWHTLGLQAARRSHMLRIPPRSQSSLYAAPGILRQSAGAIRQQTVLVAKEPWRCL